MNVKPLPRLPPLSPTGTARALFQAATVRGGLDGANAAANDHDVFPRALRATLAAHDVRDETLWAAWEVTQWVDAAPAVERRALGCLAIALLTAVEAGGTCLPLDALATSLARLGLAGADVDAACRLAAQLVDPVVGLVPLPAPPSRKKRAEVPLPLALAGLFDLGHGHSEPAAGQRRPFVLRDGSLYPERLWWLEERLAELLRPRLRDGGAPLGSAAAIDQAIRDIQNGKGALPLAAEQAAAVRAALVRPLTLVAGGPGTGKTSTVVALLRALVRLGVAPGQIALAAPTGRAAQRMRESVDAALTRLESPAPPDRELATGLTGATTLHRLLGIRSTEHAGRASQRPLDPALPEYYADWTLPQRVVIVDEASMIDLVLMEQLCAAIPPQGRLILIGDVDQLPSVQAGTVFRDLVAGAPAASCHLRRSHRMDPQDPAGADLLRVAAAVNAGAPQTAPLAVRHRAADVAFAGSERLEPGAQDEFLDRWFTEILSSDTVLELALDHRYALDQSNHVVNRQEQGRDDVAAVQALLDTMLAARILCITRTAGRNSSASAINRLLHARVQAAALARGVDESTAAGAFIPGEPVLMLRNDQTRGLANGDLGVVLRIADPRGDKLGVAFPRSAPGADQGGGHLVVHPLESIRADMALAFALTVHKAQGSEYQRVALILPEVDVPLLNREVLYTALTRARHGVVVVGDAALFNLGATRALQRTSGLMGRLTKSEGTEAVAER